MDASTRECPQCGYDYMEFYESANAIRFLCPDCGFETVEQKRFEEGNAKKRGKTEKNP
jgi:predicted RNA-binding Zn-ribbon protein involved in translation (DUF1610 family)